MFKFKLLENEQVINIYRQSEAVLFRPVIIIFTLIYFPWFFLLKYELAATYSRLLIFWTVLVFLYALNQYLIWLLNVYLLTNKRLIVIHYQNLLSKKVLESPLDKILNISFQIKGFWQTLFRFGTVKAQLPGLSETLELKNISDPSGAKDTLWKAHNEFTPLIKAV